MKCPMTRFGLQEGCAWQGHFSPEGSEVHRRSPWIAEDAGIVHCGADRRAEQVMKLGEAI